MPNYTISIHELQQFCHVSASLDWPKTKCFYLAVHPFFHPYVRYVLSFKVVSEIMACYSRSRSVKVIKIEIPYARSHHYLTRSWRPETDRTVNVHYEYIGLSNDIYSVLCVRRDIACSLYSRSGRQHVRRSRHGL